jgi:toxin ParE1/3/4
MGPWTVRLTAAAERDFEGIVAWTIEHFGVAQALVYAETLSNALEALGENPMLAEAQHRDTILKGLRSLHIARRGRKGRHFILFRIAEGGANVVEVLRVLHDAMDLQRHLPPLDEK